MQRTLASDNSDDSEDSNDSNNSDDSEDSDDSDDSDNLEFPSRSDLGVFVEFFVANVLLGHIFAH